MSILYNFIPCILLLIISHEGGHFLAALLFGQQLRFWFERFRLLWNMPSISTWKQRTIAESGFMCEFLVGIILVALAGTPGTWVNKPFVLLYFFVAVIHFAAYPWYSSPKYSDFKWMV